MDLPNYPSSADGERRFHGQRFHRMRSRERLSAGESKDSEVNPSSAAASVSLDELPREAFGELRLGGFALRAGFGGHHRHD